MSFLAPWSAVWAGAVALPLLVLLYMLRLRRRAVRVSSTLLWEQAVKDLHANEPLRRFRWSLLFVLQLLALSAMLLAIARPVVEGTSLSHDRIVIVLDRSASMRATDSTVRSRTSNDPTQPGTRWDAAVLAAERLLDELSRSSGPIPGGERPRAMIVGAAATVEPLTDFTSQIGDLRRAIEVTGATDQPLNEAHLRDYLRNLSAGASAEDESTDTPRPSTGVVLISDGGVDAAALQSAAPDGVTFTLRSVAEAVVPPTSSTAASLQAEGVALADNAGIVTLSARRTQEDPAVVRVFASVVNASAIGVTVPVLCTVDGSPRDTTQLALPPARIDRAVEGSLPRPTPGQANVTFEVLVPGRAIVSVLIARPDALAADNTASAAIEPPRPLRTLVVAPGVANDENGAADASPASPEAIADGFLLTALEAARAESIRVASPATLARWMAAGRGDVETAFDVLVLDRVKPPPQSLPRIPTLEIGFASGGDPIDASSPPERLRFVSWDRSHPIMRDVALDGVVVAMPPGAASSLLSQAGPDQALTVLGLAGSGSRRASFGLLTARERTAETQRARVVSIGFDLEASNWAPSESFPIFIANALDWLTGGTEGRGQSGSFATTGTPVTVGPFDPLLRGLSPATLQGSGVRLIGEGLDAAAIFGPDGAAGLPIPAFAVPHTLTLLDAESRPLAERSRPLPVNLLSAGESLAVVRAGGLDAAPTRVPTAPDSDAISSTGTLARRGTEIWHFFAIAALALLTIEWLAYAWLSRA